MRRIRLISLILILSLLLSGCFYSQIFHQLSTLSSSFDEMTYTRPDVDAIQQASDAVIQRIDAEAAFPLIEDALLEFESLCSDYITNYHLSNIYYSHDLTDTQWEAEYNFCLENVPKLEQIQEQLYRILARSSHREVLENDEYYGEGFFEDYDGDLLYDDHFLALSEKEAALESRYYALCEEAEDFYGPQGQEMAQLYVQLIQVRQEMAAYAGYPSFAHYAFDNHYDRDYSPQEARVYLEAMAESLVPVFYDILLADDWGYGYEPCTEAQALLYVKQAANAMGGSIQDAFTHLQDYELCDISYGENKYNASFEVFLPSYYQPFIFMNPSGDQSDKLTLAHEFGHFANDYVCFGSYAGIDVAEVHSQAFEYLSLCYSRDTQTLKNYKMVDSLFSFIQCSAHALFELQVYELTGDDLTAENILNIRREVDMQFGFDWLDWNSMDYVGVTHFFTNPMYMVSYVVSNDLAMQIYQLELAKPGEGLALYERCLESNESRVKVFAETYGLAIPFSAQRPQELAQFFQDTFREQLHRESQAA